MHSLLRPPRLFVLITYFLLSAVPFFPLFFGKPVQGPLPIIGIECALWLAAWVIFKRPAWFHWLLLPAFLALPVELYLVVYYGQGISTHHLGIITETSPREAAEFLGNKVWLLGVVLCAVIGWWAASWRAAARTRDLDIGLIPRLLALLILVAGGFLWLYAEQVGVLQPAPASQVAAASNSASGDEEDEGEEDDSEAAPAAPVAEQRASAPWSNLPQLPGWLDLRTERELFARSWPFGLGMHAYDFWKERTYLTDLKSKSRDFKFGSYQLNGPDRSQTVILVIGESSRYDRWSLNGYARKTNPLLEGESNLVSFSNVITAVAATRLAVPVMVSRKPATKSLIAGFPEKSVLSAYKEAGFKTFWLSNQMSFGQFDTPVSVYANEADVTEFLNLGSYANGSNFDQILLAPFKNALADPAPRKMIVLHTLGNHWNYSHRYPQEFDRWKPSLFGVVNPAYTDLSLKQDLNNSYDNSILYTDWFLAQVIDSVKSTAQLASLVYISDHGQTLYDGSCNLAFHGHNTQFEFHVPAFVWYSEQYQTAYPGKIERLRHNRNARLATENVFHSLLDMSDIRYPGEQLDRSFVSKKFKTHKRYVDSYGWTDYDNASFKGDCREVIDKGKPLKQEK